MTRYVIFLVILFSAAAVAQAGLDADAEQEILRLVNLERARAGLTSLHSDANLQKAARAHSRLMADAHELSHQFPGEPKFNVRLANAGASFDASGENVAFNQTAEGAHKGLMNSPPHRHNILDPHYNAVGIGVVRAGEDIFVTEDFAQEFAEQTPLEARNQVIAAFQQARRNAKLPPVAVRDEPKLQALACRMAKDGELDTKTPLGWSIFRESVAYSEPDLSHLPSTARKLAADSTVQRIAVGVCFGRNPKYESGMNFVSIAVY